MVHVKWVNPKLFEASIPKPGGIHMLMSFVGCVETLITDTGLKEILESALQVCQNLSRKNFPQNVRDLGLVTEELLCPLSGQCRSHGDMLNLLKEKSNASRTAKLGIDCLFRPVLIMMLFFRYEREAE